MEIKTVSNTRIHIINPTLTSYWFAKHAALHEQKNKINRNVLMVMFVRLGFQHPLSIWMSTPYHWARTPTLISGTMTRSTLCTYCACVSSKTEQTHSGAYGHADRPKNRCSSFSLNGAIMHHIDKYLRVYRTNNHKDTKGVRGDVHDDDNQPTES